MEISKLASKIDHTNLKPYVTNTEIEKLCLEAITNNFKMVAVNQSQTKYCKKLLENTSVHVGAAISFPLGQTTIESKYNETFDAINLGADEIDYVINIGEVKNNNFHYIKNEMETIVSLCKSKNVISKVIFENCFLNKEEICRLCEISLLVDPDYIKTSTGFGPSGATIEDVKLMLDCVNGRIKVKAAGGIRDSETFLKYVNLGVDRIGTSSGVGIIEEIKLKN